jgi:hypothetical protein
LRFYGYSPQRNHSLSQLDHIWGVKLFLRVASILSHILALGGYDHNATQGCWLA